MMENADVVRAIFRALGIPGADEVGRETPIAPATPPAREPAAAQADAGAALPERPEPDAAEPLEGVGEKIRDVPTHQPVG